MMHEITSDEVIDQAYVWVCQRRRDYSHNQDVWSLRRDWEDIKPRVQADLFAGQYRLGSVHRYQRGGEATEVWSAPAASQRSRSSRDGGIEPEIKARNRRRMLRGGGWKPRRGLLGGGCKPRAGRPFVEVPQRRDRAQDPVAAGQRFFDGLLNALVLKAIAIVLSRTWDLPRSCYHLAASGGSGAVAPTGSTVAYVFSVFRPRTARYEGSRSRKTSDALGGGRKPRGATERPVGNGSTEFLRIRLPDTLSTYAVALSSQPTCSYCHAKDECSSTAHLVGSAVQLPNQSEPRGAKAAVRDVVDHLPGNPFVFRTDVKSYYASIHHDVLMAQIRERVDDVRVLALIEQYVRRTVYCDGIYADVMRGICLGCPLSPLMGALYLAVLDERMARTGLFYARFMDDWVVLAPTRWKLRKAIKIVRETLADLKVEMHPDKTFIGRVARGFSFLGYQIASSGIVGVAVQTLERFRERVTRLYEQGAPSQRIGNYVRRWLQWVRAGLEGYVPVTLSYDRDDDVMLPRLLGP